VFADLSLWHILILLLVATLVFGAKRIPEIGASIGKGIQEFKRGLKDVTSDEPNRTPPPAAPPAQPTPDRPKRLSE
jgi:sec-independent protein translocase protein TatA